MSTAINLDLDLNGYDFADFGCSRGDSMQFAQERLGGGRGVGLDIDPSKVAMARQAGRSAHVADVGALDPKQMGTVRFVVMSHFLEHLPSLDVARKCIQSAVAVSNEFVFIRQPFFDADAYLNALGLRVYWSHWRGHRNHMKAADFHAILGDLLARRKIRRYVLFNRTRVEDSDNPAVHPLSSPIDQHLWDKDRHDPKPYYRFQGLVYREIGALIHTRERKLSEPPRRFLLHCDVVHDSMAEHV